eukprot:11494383-Prorocentrum_lima.AAC.1
MTSSLVGSEMCIRDRAPAPGRAGAVHGPSLPAPHVPLPHRHGPTPGAKGCLLYTSDAADDM